MAGSLARGLQVVLDELTAGGQAVVAGCGPAGVVEQPAGGGVDVVAPRAEQNAARL